MPKSDLPAGGSPMKAALSAGILRPKYEKGDN